jgi:hypothetical protein
MSAGLAAAFSARSSRVLAYLAVAVAAAASACSLSGCARERFEPVEIYPERKSGIECVGLLRELAGSAPSLRANGKCVLRYRENGKVRKESFPVKIWIKPPSEVYLQGDIAFDPRAVVVGSNEREFWIWIKPGKISTYWWGLWPQVDPAGRIPLNPRLVLEAMGSVADLDGPGVGWTLGKSRDFEVLSIERDAVLTKRLYLDCRYCAVAKVEYFYPGGAVAAAMDLENYRSVGSDRRIPARIRIVSSDPDGEESVRIDVKLDSVKETVFSEAQLARLFSRPKPRGFKHVYRLVGQRWFER